ncbi:hypothetical protein [Xanthomonas axonopodis]|uniref:hypothetical protein n=1 Tax=Xanthomonas axonopodis TaxID=53413 RepID=UPI000A8C4CCC
MARSSSTAYVTGSACRIDLTGDFYNPTTLRLVGNDYATEPLLWTDPTGVREGLNNET